MKFEEEYLKKLELEMRLFTEQFKKTQPSLNVLITALVERCIDLDLDGSAYRGYLIERGATLEDADIIKRIRANCPLSVRPRYAELLDGLQSGKDIRSLLQAFFEQHPDKRNRHR